MSTFYLVQGDNGSQIKTTITRSDTGEPVDLRSATPRLKFKKRNSSTVLTTINSSTTAEEEKQNGICRFAFGSSDLDINAGEYLAEIEISFNDGTIETVYEELEFTLREDY